MKQILYHWRDLSPKRQLPFWAVLIVILLLVCHFALGGTLLSPEERFRRVEAAEFLGPAPILGTIGTGDVPFNQAILAADEHSVCVYLFNRYDDMLFSAPRREPFTLLFAQRLGSVDWYAAEGKSLTAPLILFDDHPKAARAELTLNVGEQTWQLTADRMEYGFFRFDLTLPQGHSPEENLAFAGLYTHLNWSHPLEGSARVRFFDYAENLIAEETLPLAG